jgi:hypothetical protein
MPAATSTVQFLDIPAGVTGDALIALVNDRLRAITQALNTATPMPAIASDLNMNGYRVVVLGNAVNPQDALNMATGDKRYATSAAIAKAVATAAAVPAAGGGASSSVSVLILTVPGTLAIEASATALVIFSTAQSWTKVNLLVEQAPTDGAITISAKAGTKILGTATIAAGAVAGSATISWTLPANTVLSVDVTTVGLDNPGSGLSILLS